MRCGGIRIDPSLSLGLRGVETGSLELFFPFLFLFRSIYFFYVDLSR